MRETEATTRSTASPHFKTSATDGAPETFKFGQPASRLYPFARGNPRQTNEADETSPAPPGQDETLQLTMNTLVDLLGKDGLKVADLESIYAASRDTGRLIADAIGAMRHLDAEIAWRAVWILKRSARDGKLSADDVIRIAKYAEELPHWASRLNLCQLFAKTGCPKEAREDLVPYLAECFANRSPIVRAWAISVLVGFEDDLRFQATINACLDEARADSTASIQARLRRLKKQSPRQPRPARDVSRKIAKR
jgi:hypothetical protein